MPGKTKRKKPQTPVRVVARVICVDDDNYSVRLRAETAIGIRKTLTIVRPDFLRTQTCMAELARKGARLPAGMQPKDFHTILVQQEEECEHFIFTTHVTGWHGGCYVMPEWNVGRMANGHPLEFAGDTSSVGSAARAGTLKSWKAEVAKPAAYSSYVVMALCWAVAPVLLRFIRTETASSTFRPVGYWKDDGALPGGIGVW